MDRKSLFLVLVSFLGFLWLLGRQLDPPVCINSKTVKNLVIEETRDSGLTTIPSCQQGLSNVKKTTISKETYPVMRQAQEIYKLDLLFNNKIEPVKIIIANSFKAVKITPRLILIPRQTFDINPNILSMALISSLVQQSYPEVGSYHRSILEDFYTSVVNHKLTVGGYKLDRENFIAANYITSLNDYCKAGWQSLLHRSYCKRQNSYIKKSKMQDIDSITSWSFRPLVVGFLFEAYNKMGAYPSLSWLKNLDHSKIKYKVLQIKLPQVLVKNQAVFESAKQILTGYAKAFNFKDKKISLQAKQRLVFSDLENHQQSLKVQRDKFKVTTDFTQWFSAVDETVVFSCRPSRLKDFLKYRQSQWILYVNLCEKDSVNWRGLFAGELKKFLADNKHLSFYLFHGPSFRLAKQKYPSVMQLSKSPINAKTLGQAFKWSDSMDVSQETETIKPRSVIEAVHSFREI